MLKQGSVSQIRTGELTKQSGHLVVTMCFYPRGLKKMLFHEYQSKLAPDRALFKDFKKYQKEFGHEEGFKKSNYEKRFALSPESIEKLQALSQLSKEKDVYLICQCEMGDRCHREMLLILAKEKFKAKTDTVKNDYPVFKNLIPTDYSN